MPRIFISYRRDDSGGRARLLFSTLEKHFGKESVFMDVETIEYGRNFLDGIKAFVAKSDAALVVIGRDWLGAKDHRVPRRIDEEADFVRLETVAVLERDMPVIPVLVDGATMPASADLPKPLGELAFRHGIELTHARWDSDVQVLIKALERSIKMEPTAPPVAISNGMKLKILGLLALVVVVIAGAYLGDRVLQAREAARIAQAEAVRVAKQEEAEAASKREQAARDEALAKAAAERKIEEIRALAKQREAESRKAEEAARLAAAKAAESAKLDPYPSTDSVNSVTLASYNHQGARFDVSYQAQSREPRRTGVRVCLTMGGYPVKGTGCTTSPVSAGAGSVSIDMQFRDDTAISIQHSRQAIVQTCLVTYSVQGARSSSSPLEETCKTRPW